MNQKRHLRQAKYLEAGIWLVSMMKTFKVTSKKYHNSYGKPSMYPGMVIEGEGGLKKNNNSSKKEKNMDKAYNCNNEQILDNNTMVKLITQ